MNCEQRNIAAAIYCAVFEIEGSNNQNKFIAIKQILKYSARDL